MLKNILSLFAVVSYLCLAILTFTYTSLRVAIWTYEMIAEHIEFLRRPRTSK